MAEDPNVSEPGRNICSHSSITVEAELSAKDDLNPGLYEGGFKTWECAVDLAGYLAGQSGEIVSTLGTKGLHVIEVSKAFSKGGFATACLNGTSSALEPRFQPQPSFNSSSPNSHPQKAPPSSVSHSRTTTRPCSI